MALIRRDDNLSVKVSTSLPGSSSVRRKQIVLEEDEFIDALDKIIERDFFPALSKMKQQLKTFGGPIEEIQVTGDLTGLISRATFDTPSTFGTPIVPTASEVDESEEVIEETNETDKRIKTNLSLNAFLARYTSEDNASFDEIMVEAEKRHREKYPWLYVKGNSSLALPSTGQVQAIEGENSQNQLTYHYKSLNSIMFVPDGLKIEDQINAIKHTKICHENTRFKNNPFNEHLNEAALAEAAASNSKVRSGKIGIDGKEVQDSPRLGGYSFQSLTPSPAPGVTNTPLMTWGEIEGTPFSLDGSDTPYIGTSATPGTPHFKIPDVPEREKIGHALADKINRKKRDKKKEAFKQAQYLRNSPLICSGGRTLSESLGTMSPAAQKLATSRLGINKHVDKELRGSYSPAILRTPESRSPLTLTLTPSPSSSHKSTSKKHH